MKTYIITFVTIILGNLAIAGNGNYSNDNKRLISGKVIDKVSGEEIAGAEIKIDEKVIYTDLNGKFLANIYSVETLATISFVSYADLKVNIDPHSFGEIVVELESK